MKVMKFGGSSVKDAECIRKVITIIKENNKPAAPPVVVVSACGKTTNRLLALAETALTEPDLALSELEDIVSGHKEIAASLLDKKGADTYSVILSDTQEALSNVLRGISLIEEITPRSLDYIASSGEHLSSNLIALALEGAGTAAMQVDARRLIMADPPHGSGLVRRKESAEAILHEIGSNNKIIIVPGFVASTPEGHTITLGRGGSDYSASIIGAALQAEVIEIWTDVDGMMTADPARVPRAFCQEEITYEEAMELSHFGARVIYPPTIQPAIEFNIPILIKNTFNPVAPGSRIHRSGKADRDITGISSVSNIALIRLQGSGMVGVTGISGRVFGALADAGISAILISQASSEHTICFAVLPEFAERAGQVLIQTFQYEIARHQIDSPVIEENLAVISVVGEQMRNRNGIAARVFGSLGNNGVNVVAIAQGSSERNISAVISSTDEEKALRALHEEFFFPERKFINVFLAGTGLIGSSLLQQINDHMEMLSREHHHEIRLIGVMNSRMMCFDEEGLNSARVSDRLNEGTLSNISSFIEKMSTLNLPNKVFVDCTASDLVSKAYEEILNRSIHIVTPNKRAQSCKYLQFKKLKDLSVKKNVTILWETSVGAGLPVINTLNDLIKSGDRLHRIEAVLSGTLSYIFNSFDGEVPFSEVVKVAREKGFTEPDPRDDLNGADVARKILILAREAGATMEPETVEVENLVPESCRSAASIDQFFNSLAQEDEYFSDLLATARLNGKRLCYIAAYENGSATVRLQQIDEAHPFYNLSGSDNIISFTTDRYRERPLVVKGPGAGAEVTAAGVFADIIRLASFGK